MSEQDVFNLQLRKNTFYRDKFRKIMKLINLLVISASVLLGTFIYQSLTPDNVKYYGSSTNGEQTPLSALSDPVLTERLVIQWANIASKKVYQLNFENYSNQLDAMKLAEYMQNLTYRIKEDHEMANRLSRCADKLSEIDASFGTRWDRDFDQAEKRLIRQCHKMMSDTNAPA